MTTCPGSDWLAQCQGHLERLRDLEQDWDSYGAAGANDAAVALASQVLRALQAAGLTAPQIGPSAEEGVCIFYRIGGLYADIECFNTGEIVAAAVDAKGVQRVWEVRADSEDIARAAGRLRDHLVFQNR